YCSAYSFFLISEKLYESLGSLAAKFLNDELSTDFKYPALKMGRNFVSDDSWLHKKLSKL
ncbi:hypothetical protein, partial [Acinetobacter baumannii]|uniref:hypothetical protein n=1 Tax=Acinetobacter baumannii TaxID=470 RepID=UPI003AF9B440